MSGDADNSGLRGVVRDSVGDALGVDDLESMLEGDTPRAVGRELGARVGRKYGAFIGRELGAVVAVDIRERKGPRAILADVKRRLKELLRSIVQRANFRSSLSRLRKLASVVDGDGGAVELLEAVVPDEGDDTDEDDAGESDGNGDGGAVELLEAVVPDEGDDTGEDDAGESDENGDGAEAEKSESESEEESEGFIAEMPVDDLDDMREETYRELLEVMSYRDLQSVAKEVGVKANLSQEEMTDRIVEEFSERRNE